MSLHRSLATMRKMQPGTLGGQSRVATPVSPVDLFSGAIVMTVVDAGCSTGIVILASDTEEWDYIGLEDDTFATNDLELSHETWEAFPNYDYFTNWPSSGDFTVTVIWDSATGIDGLLLDEDGIFIDESSTSGDILVWTFTVVAVTDRLVLRAQGGVSEGSGTVEICPA